MVFGGSGPCEAMPRDPKPMTVPSRVTTRASGWAAKNHAGGEAVGVPRSTAMPLACSRSSSSSSHAKSKTPSLVSSSAHEKIPTLTRLTPASRMSATSSDQTSRGHCSGV
ncbi:hypothetical protein D9M71_809020 [compost metagenome]